ncbi:MULTISPECIES: peptidoglycan DD-metalloendopeptidase family protein [Pseudoalteromonas]|uniref:peptidoglycan DD-metalloendopeptidase family protein n=1 Tax=Pseudoalteromonas TaxID=53246 RepID=UPI00014CC394|nr:MULTISPECIES: peptidoglycan DD-metalloendopeptidase family protein [Pseudoalteromonas]MDC3190689.1 peptidoglycan DD-metalloendopeptidase family protein [Pseudoalteromonas elyakovii]KPW02163.1 Murein hydrolase activator NlpD precursor [Pseudoalteromonas sp. P1-8]KPZ73969.1 Murein hydrolase activator NlpD precursor [Pseudoalteromonas sp. P1-26]KTG19609.1 peptidoglycan-binding protein [Pseudoalteromonas sp. XI10]MCG9732908.1 peptidoglycan DD-metalloendopeptidase family protein [Pseudoalteromon|tara:strand:- start:140 stop:964 length:825 start_codon:yes stop_codon:yes gene_type:complete
MSRQLTVYVTLFLSILLFGCTSREAPAPVSSLDNKVKPATRKVNISGSKYVVKKGDTLYSIAFSAQQDFRTLAKINDIPAPYTIFPGQSISLTKSAQKSKKTKKYTNSSKKSTVSIQKNNKKLKKGLDQPKQREYVQKQANKIISEKKRNSNAKVVWGWPAKGKVTKRFSNKENGFKGLQITNKQGASVLAAAHGTVVYAGNALRGYGNLIILKHNDDYLSAYAHNSKLLVKEKQEVKAGQKIAEMGSSDSSVTALRFEIRYRGQAVNPAKYLP